MAATSCGKTRYRDQIGAKLALARIERKNDASRSKTEKRCYRCPSCKGWHLTSKR